MFHRRLHGTELVTILHHGTAQRTFRGNVVARHYGVATDSPCGTGGLNMTSTFRVRSTHSEYTGIVRSTYTAPAILK